jgi:indole-3-glycerol phosphate synthase/phosphoribosylanthranilate isomerase
MLSVLDDAQFLACQEQAHALNMDVLTEIFSMDEAIRAINLKANFIGINHRNLHTMTLDMDRVRQLAPLFPKETIIIAASGIKTHQDIQLLNPFVNGFLIGSSLSRSINLEMTMRELIFGAVKICGLTRKQDVIKAYQSGASYGGLIFVDKSPRKVTVEQALEIAVAPLQYVGVFLDQSLDLIATTAKKLNLHAVQLHGYSDEQTLSALRKQLPFSCEIWLALDGNESLPTTLPQHVNKIVIDNLTKHQGGTGKVFNWDTIKQSCLLPHLILAGGLSCTNIEQAKKMGTWGLDINSGVEQAPGIKDHQFIDDVFTLLRKR